MNRGICRGCGQPIIWIKTPAGKSMPCDPGEIVYWANPKGPVKIVTPNGEVISAETHGNTAQATGIGYISHFVTCPEAGTFRRR